jgi:hypothetical protein
MRAYFREVENKICNELGYIQSVVQPTEFVNMLYHFHIVLQRQVPRTHMKMCVYTDCDVRDTNFVKDAE